MRVKSSNREVKGLECIDPNRNIWRLRWDILNGSYEEIELRHKPTIDEIKSIVLGWYNSQVEENIKSGFIFQGRKLYLNKETQMNINLFSDASVFPLTLKMGEEYSPVFVVFNTKEELKNLKNSMASHIKKCLREGWDIKSNINWSIYE